MLSDILIYPAVWPQQTWAENWGICPLFGPLGTVLGSARENPIVILLTSALSAPPLNTSRNTMWPGPRPIFVPSGILIHPAVWPFGHNRHGPEIGGGGCAPWHTVREFGAPQQISTSFASCLRYCCDVPDRRPIKLCTMFGPNWPSPELVHYISYILSGLLPLTEFCPRCKTNTPTSQTDRTDRQDRRGQTTV